MRRAPAVTGAVEPVWGLIIVKSLVEAHEGSLSITSQMGQGTTVAVSLPSGG